MLLLKCNIENLSDKVEGKQVGTDKLSKTGEVKIQVFGGKFEKPYAKRVDQQCFDEE
jgi:hypothetical protein